MSFVQDSTSPVTYEERERSILWSAYLITADSMYDLLDRAVDETLQLEITRLLALHFHAYDAFHGVRTRRSGAHIYIEVYLGFDGHGSWPTCKRRSMS